MGDLSYRPEAVRNVVFDLGGVVINWDVDAVVRMITDDMDTRQRIKKDVLLHPDWLELDRGTFTEEEAAGRFARRIGRTVGDVMVMMRTADRSLTLKEGTVAIMRDLIVRGYTLYCLSNLPVERWAYLQDTHDIWDMFGGIVISGHLKMVKPEPGIYRHLTHTYGLAPESCLFLDDVPQNVEGARAVGWQGILFTTPEAGRTALTPLLGG